MLENLVKWHPYPEEMPPVTDHPEEYLVTVERYSRRYVSMRMGDHTGIRNYAFVNPATRIVAWAFMPEEFKGAISKNVPSNNL